MTNEEAINYLKISMAIGEDDDSRHHNEVLKFIIKALEPEPCEDAVSRNVIIQKLNTMDRYVSEELRLCDTDKKFPKNEVFIVDDVYEEIVEILPSAQSEVAKDTNVPSNDCISRQEAIDALYHVDEYNGRSVEAIMNLPSAEPKIGKWILSGGYWRCSECKEKALLKLDKAKGNCKEYAPVRSMFCPNCGVKMLQTDSEPQAEREDNE